MKRAYALVASAGGQGEVTGWLLIHDSDGRAAGDPVQFEGILAEAGGDSTVVANAALNDAAIGDERPGYRHPAVDAGRWSLFTAGMNDPLSYVPCTSIARR